jgi:hypothetical protein
MTMYAQARQAKDRHREHLARASAQREASRVLAMRKASRRMARAERRLVDAQSSVLKARGALNGGW